MKRKGRDILSYFTFKEKRLESEDSNSVDPAPDSNSNLEANRSDGSAFLETNLESQSSTSRSTVLQ